MIGSEQEPGIMVRVMDDLFKMTISKGRSKEGVQYEKKYFSLGKYSAIENSFMNEVSEISKNHKIIL